MISKKENLNEETMLFILFGVFFMVVGFLSLYMEARQNLSPQPSQQVGCTREAKLCPDGSYVSRTGPNCEFAVCPSPLPYENL